MVKVNNLFALERVLTDKLDLLIERCSKKSDNDSALLVDGGEGLGKSTLITMMAYYVSWKTGREFSVDNIFFDLDEMIQYAANNKEKIIIWDEAAVAGLSVHSTRRMSTKLTQLLMMARKKRHFYFLAIPKFYRLNEYLITRCQGLVHVYSPDKGLTKGLFVYYRDDVKNKMYEVYLKNRRVPEYKKWYSKYNRGRFSNHMSKIIDVEKYEAKKDKAILDLTKDEKKEKINVRELNLRKKFLKIIAKKREEGLNVVQACKYAGLGLETYYEWQKKFEEPKSSDDSKDT